LRIWNHTKKEHVLSHQAHEAAIIGLDYDRATNTAATGASDKLVKVWRYTSDPRATVQAMGSRDIKALLVKHNISTIDCFEKSDLVDKALANKLVSTVSCLHTCYGHSGAIIGLNIDSKTGVLASASFDQTVRLWDLKNNGKHIATFSEHKGTVNVAQIEGSQMLTGSNDAKVLKSDINTGQVVQEFNGHIGWVWNLCYSPSVLLTSSIDHKVRVWDSVSAKSVAILDSHKAEVAGLHADFNNNKFISSAFDGKLYQWDLRNLRGGPILTVINSERHTRYSNDDRMTRCTFDENMIAAATFGEAVMMWDFRR